VSVEQKELNTATDVNISLTANFSSEGNSMKRLYRRGRQQYLLAIVLGVIALVNVLFFISFTGRFVVSTTGCKARYRDSRPRFRLNSSRSRASRN
jgi:hypothetical protein